MPQITDLVPDGGRLDNRCASSLAPISTHQALALRVFGITLRRRVGGSETGWQFEGASGHRRTELQRGSRAKDAAPGLGERAWRACWRARAWTRSRRS
jgi:hypothetical protein